MINEFKRGGAESMKKTMSIGYGEKLHTKAWKVLDFIKSFGDAGVRMTEIQKYIFVDLNGNSEEDFHRRTGFERYDYKKEKYVPSKGNRATRGYWTTALYGQYGSWGEGKKGLLPEYCRQNPNGKWVFDHYPTGGGNIFTESWDQKIISKSLKNI